MKAYKPIRSTKGQRDKLRKLNKGVGFLVYHSGNGETIETEFYIHRGELFYITNGEKVEFEVTESVE
jgi:hypothetical protein